MNKYMMVGAILIVGLFVGGAIAYQSGYIPITGMLEVKEPEGDAREIRTDIGIEVDDEDSLTALSGILKNVPNLDKIKYEVYETDLGYYDIYEGYRSDLKSDGYEENKDYSGVVNVEGYQVHYYSFIKGMTGVAIAMAPKTCCDTYVLYTTGNVMDYKEILEWVQDRGYV